MLLFEFLEASADIHSTLFLFLISLLKMKSSTIKSNSQQTDCNKPISLSFSLDDIIFALSLIRFHHFSDSFAFLFNLPVFIIVFVKDKNYLILTYLKLKKIHHLKNKSVQSNHFLKLNLNFVTKEYNK